MPAFRKPYARKPAYKKRFTKKPYVKKGPQKYIPKARSVELKYMDSEATASVLATSGNRYLLNGNVQGTTVQTRIGNRAMIKKIELKMQLNTNVSGTFKIAIVIDKEASGVVMAMADLYNSIGGLFLPWGTRNSVKGQRFIVLKNIEITINPNISASAQKRSINKYINCNLPVQYNGGVAGTIADIQTNALYVVVTTDIGTATFSYTSRCRFSDD